MKSSIIRRLLFQLGTAALVVVHSLSMAAVPTVLTNDIIYQSLSDLWDVSNGTEVTASSGIHYSSDARKMFGFSQGGEATRAVFADGLPPGTVHFVEWQTPTAVTVRSLRLMAVHDPSAWGVHRAFGNFRLLVFDPNSGSFQLVFNFQAAHPYYHFDDAANFEVINLPATTAQKFRAEFEQVGQNGPRIVELDAFDTPEPPPQPYLVSIVPGSTGFYESLTVAVNVSPSDAVLRFTTSGSIPFYASALYAGPVTISESTTISARAFIDDFPVSPTAVGDFVLKLAEPPTVISQPEGLAVNEGSTARFSVVAAGTGPIRYQWKRNGVDLVEGTKLRGTDSAELSIVGVEHSDEGDYSVLLSNSAGTVISSAARLSILAFPRIVSGPPAFRVCAQNSECAMEIAATGAAPLACQWRFNGVDIPGATNFSLVLTSIQAGQAGMYTARVTNPVGVADSDPAVVNVDDGVGGTVTFSNHAAIPVFDTDGVTPLVGPAFLAQLYAGPSAGELAAVGAAVPFLPAASPGVFFGGLRHVPLVSAGQTAQVQVRVWESGKGTTYELAVANGSKFGASVVLGVVTGGAGEPPSPPAPLSGLASFALTTNPSPQIKAGPAATMALLGSEVTFRVEATGQPVLGYQWLFQGAPLAGANGPVLTLPSARVADAGEYRVEVSNGVGTNLSAPASLEVRAGLVVNAGAHGQVVVTPDGTSFAVGSSAELRAEPEAGYLFAGWSGALAGESNPASLVMDTNKTVGASFVRGWTLAATAGAGGTVSRSPDRPMYPDGSSVLVKMCIRDRFTPQP